MACCREVALQMTAHVSGSSIDTLSTQHPICRFQKICFRPWLCVVHIVHPIIANPERPSEAQRYY
ncbi:hypothetical protein I79_008609 [Cricetulus griseus]|uniref:Uncharacterized protein n=1 Tax=Cricetulus griseus TaxID=10029 RepID=G3HDM3_CRIGR|nr:hypothetical protein I79_008609 [Cricetulus griseus]